MSHELTTLRCRTFTTNKRPDALMNTSYLATCCRALHRQREHPTDELVVHLVRAQQLSQSISQGFARRKAGQNESQVPQAAFVQVLQGRVQAFVAALPPHIRADRKQNVYFFSFEVMTDVRLQNRWRAISRWLKS